MAKEITEKLMHVYNKRNTPRLVRTTLNLIRAQEREIGNGHEFDLPEHRQQYYSHRLHILEQVLKERGVNARELDIPYGLRPQYETGRKRKTNGSIIYSYDQYLNGECLPAMVREMFDLIEPTETRLKVIK